MQDKDFIGLGLCEASDPPIRADRDDVRLPGTCMTPDRPRCMDVRPHLYL
ncbi:MAG: hypothetical protein QXR65_09585 [Candidatus Bathyarchaeia archaeon]